MKKKLATITTIKPVHIDGRGTITDIINKSISHVGCVSFKKGALRAKHYHHKSTQYDYVMSGKLRLVVCLPDGSEREDYILGAGMFSEVPPGVVHTYIAEEDSVMIDMTTLSRDDDGYEEDTVRVDLDIK
ncbi:MAG: cupin domain-containing protein [Patescibacteria group bacterium UBA2163]